MIIRPFCLLIAALVGSASQFFSAQDAVAGPKDATLLIVRHAEKPDEGNGLTPAGEARAKAYVEYFTNFKFHADPIKPDEIFAAADSKNSQRPRLTVEPLAHALNLPVNTSYKDKDFTPLVTTLQSGHDGKNILVCWHRGAMPELLKALGGDPNALLPGGHWPEEAYDWVIVLRYDQEGHLKDTQRIDEGLTAAHGH